jgi:6-phosphogluconolactonase
VTVFVGSYGSGISIFERDGARLTFVDRVDTPDPSYLVADPYRPVLYAVDELTDPSVASFAIEERGGSGPGLRELSRQPTGGAAPCHLLRHPAGYLLAANYDSGSVSVHPIGPDGVLGPRTDLVQHTGSGPDPERQQGPHAHEVKLAGDLVVVIDLGLDKMIGYRLDPATGRLSVAADPFARTHPGAGPRHAVAHGGGRWYVADELDSTVAVFDPDPSTGVLREVATVPATGRTPSQPAGIALSRDATRLYVSNRGADTIVTFSLDDRGDLTMIDEVDCGGSWPRHFTIVDDVLLVANQKSDSVVSFALDPATGLPRPTGDVITVGSPTCVLPN